MEYILFSFDPCRDWTLHSSPPPAHPSYRLITALRLFHIIDDKGTSLPLKSEKLVAKWKDVINGNVDAISPSNEQEWRQGLLAICDQVVLRAKTGLEGIARSTFDGQSPEWLEWMKGNIRCLWQEELEVAQAVILSVESGEEF